MSLTIESSSTTSTLLQTSTPTSGAGGATFVVNPTTSATTSASTSASSSARPISQLSSDLQSMLTDLQAIGSEGVNEYPTRAGAG
jgi:hypothetical protein